MNNDDKSSNFLPEIKGRNGSPIKSNIGIVAS